jgi:peptidoglycan hydrolase CwlO-like protein
MDDNNKELLKQIQILMAATEAKQDRRSDATDQKLENLSNEFNSWRPRLESRVDELHVAVTVLQQQAVITAGASRAPTSTDGDSTAAHLAASQAVAGASILGPAPVGVDLGQGHGA